MKLPTIEMNKHRKKLLFLLISGAFGIILLVIAGYQLLEFTDSTQFCGELCHKVMYPEYTAHAASPHANVACAQCHVGYGGGYLVRSKISGIPQLFAVLFNTYPRPIETPVQNLRPARATCEECHQPSRFAGDLVETHTTYASDESNTETVDTRVLRVGGGEQEVASGIHWHINAKVYYLADDKDRQDIIWVGVDRGTGYFEEYVDPSKISEITPDRIAKQARLMDCIDCHNRTAHDFPTPDTLIDEAMTQGKIDTSLPYIKKEGLAAVDPISPSLDAAYAKIAAIKDFYKTDYPDVYATKGAAIDEAITALDNVAKLTTFPHMNITPETYINNIGHIDSPGCFRCHGKLVAYGGANAGQAISNDCDLCHYFTLQ
jgi:nitrate/TMAO reductase-like tetraheme cytochrome c subunit